MTCSNYRAMLQREFDERGSVPMRNDGHAVSCPECAAYRARLASISAAFTTMPLETPSAGFAARVKSRLADAQAQPAEARWWIPAAALVACMCLFVSAWYFAVPTDVDVWRAWLEQSAESFVITDVAWDETASLVTAQMNEASALLAQFSTPLMWGAAIAVAILVFLLNAAELRSLRTANRFQRRWS